MLISALKNNRGIALLMTLAFITLAISLALETNRQARFSIESCTARQDRLTAGQMASAGVHAAMAILIEDRYASETDHLKEGWSDRDQLNEQLAAIAFEEGRVEVVIEDEAARLQINALVDFPQGRQFVPAQQQFLVRLIQQVREALEDETTDTTPTDIVNAIKDWLDAGDDDAITGLNGAESEYYQNLDPPYNCRNGPIRHISELGRIKGISEAVMRGDPAHPGLADHLTVFGASVEKTGPSTFPGTVNLNTVSPTVLRALLTPEYQDLTDLIVEFRDGADPMLLETSDWHRQAPGASDVEIDPELISFSSAFFRIRSTAYLHNVERRVTAVVERRKNAESGNWGCRVIDWEIH